LNPTWAKLSGSPEDRPGRGSGGQGDGGAGLAQHGLPVELRRDVDPGRARLRVHRADHGADLHLGSLIVVGALDQDAGTARIDITSKFNGQTVLGKARATVTLA